jgi:hypothetical protein
MERWLVVFDRRDIIGTSDRDDQVRVGCVGAKAIGDQSGILQWRLIALKQLARTGNFSSFANSRGGQGDRHALPEVTIAPRFSRMHLPSKASVLGNCPRCWPSQPLSALAMASKSNRGSNSR